MIGVIGESRCRHLRPGTVPAVPWGGWGSGQYFSSIFIVLIVLGKILQSLFGRFIGATV